MGDKSLRAVAWCAALLVFFDVASLICFLSIRGLPVISSALFFGDTAALDAMLGRELVWDGIWPAVAGTLSLLSLTMALSVLPGVGCGAYLAFFASPRTKKLLGLAVDLMAGIPSIVMGLFGFVIILALRHLFAQDAGTCLALSAFCLSLLVLPSLVVSAKTALESLPDELSLTGESLGFSPWQTLRHVLLPAGIRGITGGIMLALGRAAEDTAVIMMTGAVASAGMPSGLTAKYEALPFFIFYISAQYTDQADLARGFGAANVLLLLSAALLFCAWLLQRSVERRWKGVY